MASSAQSPRQRRYIERAEAIVIEPAYVRFEKIAQIRNAVFEHGDAINPHAPSVTLPSVGIEAAIAQNIGVDHAAAENLQPVLTFAKADFGPRAIALDVDLHRRRREGK